MIEYDFDDEPRILYGGELGISGTEIIVLEDDDKGSDLRTDAQKESHVAGNPNHYDSELEEFTMLTSEDFPVEESDNGLISKLMRFMKRGN